MIEGDVIVVAEVVEAWKAIRKGLARCLLCAAPIPLEVPPLCLLCLDIEASNERAYREEQEQARRPF